MSRNSEGAWQLAKELEEEGKAIIPVDEAEAGIKKEHELKQIVPEKIHEGFAQREWILIPKTKAFEDTAYFIHPESIEGL